MQLQESNDIHGFHDLVLPFLCAREAENCTLLGILLSLKSNGVQVHADHLAFPRLIAVVGDQGVELVAMQTLRSQMLVSRGSAPAAMMLARHLAEQKWNAQHLNGELATIEIVSAEYSRQTGRARSIDWDLRSFELRQITWPARTSGSMRQCEPGDRSIVGRYLIDFGIEIAEPYSESPEEIADRIISQGRLHCWEDCIEGKIIPVATAAWAGPTPNGVRINAVFTPRHLRGRGYASNVVAALTDKMLKQGRQFCFLFTDLANPTSNSIYQKIGYQPICDYRRWRFVE